MASNRLLRPFGLETFSFWVAKRLLERHPEWLSFVSPIETEQDGMKVRTLAIELPSQNPLVSEPLTIAVDLSRIVGVSWFPMRGTLRWHEDWVFYMPGVSKPTHWEHDYEGVDRLAEFVERFTAEEAAAIWTDDGIGEGGTFGNVTAQDVRDGVFRRGKERTEIRSWKGSLDMSL